MHTCTTRRRNRCPRLVPRRFVPRGGPRQRLSFETETPDEEDDYYDNADVHVFVQDDSDADVSCGQPSNPARQRLQNTRMQRKARKPRAWKTLETCRSIEAALDLVSTTPPPYDNTWRARLHNDTKPWIRRSPMDENLKPDSKGIKKVIFCCGHASQVELQAPVQPLECADTASWSQEHLRRLVTMVQANRGTTHTHHVVCAAALHMVCALTHVSTLTVPL